MNRDKLYKNKMSMFDFIKGVAIFAVIYCHTLECWDAEPGFFPLVVINGIFGACWIPAFMLSSAYWYKPKPVKNFTQTQAKGLLIPILQVELLLVPVYIITHYVKYGYMPDCIKGVYERWLGALIGNQDEFFIHSVRICNVGPMWFVVTLFVTSVIVNLIMNQDKIKNKLIPIMVFTVIGVLFGKFKWQIYCFSAAFAGTLCFYIGYRLKETKFLIRKWTKREYAMMWGLVLAGYIIIQLLSGAGLYSNAVYVVFCIPMGIMALRIGLCITKKFDNVFTRFFQKLGRYIIWILIVHTVEVLCIDWRWFKDWHVFAALPPHLSFAIVLAIRCLVVAVGVIIFAQMNKLWSKFIGDKNIFTDKISKMSIFKKSKI